MWIYLLIGLLLLVLASESYFKGGVNAVVTLLGVVLAVNVADSFGPMAFQWMGDKWWPIDEHPFWNRAAPVVAGFITLVVIFRSPARWPASWCANGWSPSGRITSWKTTRP